jgi:hypothetical protein
VIGITVAILIGKFGGSFINFFAKTGKKMRSVIFSDGHPDQANRLANS